MKIKNVSLECKSDLEFVEKLYIESFPPSERRSVLHMQHLVAKEDRFFVNIFIDEDNNRIGFLSYWTLDGFIFIEHFAIASEYRNEGYGGKTLTTFINQMTLPLLAEIELPSYSEFAQRRLNFYERFGFRSWDIPYEQPPYEDGFDAVPMLLLTYGELDLYIKREAVVNQLLAYVYVRRLSK